MKPPESDRRSFLTAGAALSLGAVLPGPASAASDATVLAQAAGRPTPAAAAAAGRLTFHGSDVYHGLTIGTMRVDVSMLEGNAYRLLKTFDTAKDGRSDGAWFEGPTFKPGRYYLYAGGSAGSKLRVYEMADDMVNLRREIPVQTPPKFTEGPFMHFRNGVYFLSYSHGGWRDASYSVHYATSSTPVGPWRYRGAILTSDEHHKGPGHHSIFRGPAPDEWYIAYHRWNNATGNGPYHGQRQVAIEPLHHEFQTWIRPVKMTNYAPTLSHEKKS